MQKTFSLRFGTRHEALQDVLGILAYCARLMGCGYKLEPDFHSSPQTEFGILFFELV